MKKPLHKAGLLLMVFVYSIACMGFGVHHCDVDNTTTVMLLDGTPLCGHTHAHLEHGKILVHSHDSQCCHTRLILLDRNQLSEKNLLVPAYIACLQAIMPDDLPQSLCEKVNLPNLFTDSCQPYLPPNRDGLIPLRL